MNLTLHVWRQASSKDTGSMKSYKLADISPDCSFLEMLDQLNEQLIGNGEEPVAFDHDCREGICGTCSLVINGNPHGPQNGTTTCQLHMRSFKDGDEIYVEPFRARAFPVIRDLVVDRGSFDRIQQAGGFISISTGNAPEAHAAPVPKVDADHAFQAAACIGCGACVAACKNSSAMLFVSAKIGHLSRLPQGQAERNQRVLSMVDTMDQEGFGNCTNQYECEAVCPKEISAGNIALMNFDLVKAALTSES